jgi:large subunit ribosomal protein L33
MGSAKKGATILVKLASTAGTGFFYVARKNPRKLTEKLQFMKYDPRVRKHVLFTETKLK